MRGKISYYNDKTGTGMISTQFKRTFEFKRSAWHDFHNAPKRGMFVFFRIDESKHVVDCKESVFRVLKRDYDLTAKDFWESNSEEELRDLAEQKKEELINLGVTSLTPTSKLQESRTIDECCNAFFAEPIAIIYKYQEILTQNIEAKQLDYFIAKRFLLKAKGQLMNTDTSTSAEHFADMERELSTLEQQYAIVARQMKTELDESFETIYLAHQIAYLRFLRRISLDSERLFQIDKLIKKNGFDIEMVEKKLAMEQNEKNQEKLREKLEKLQEHGKELEREKTQTTHNRVAFAKQIKEFRSRKYNEFVGGYGFEEQRKKVHDYIRSIMNHIAYKYDGLLWEKARHSESIHNTFFRQNTEGSYCIMTFIRYYLKQLDKNRLSPSDQLLYKYLRRYEKERCYSFLILSDDRELVEKIRMTIFSLHKDFLVYTFPRAVESLNWIKANLADFIILDHHLKTPSPQELIAKNIQYHKNEKIHSHYLMINSPSGSKNGNGKLPITFLKSNVFSASELQKIIESFLPKLLLEETDT